MKNTSQGYPRNYTANTTGDILQVAEKIYFMAKVSTTPFSLGINRISYLYEKMSQNKKGMPQLTSLSLDCVLSHEDSNLDRQNQKL